MKNIDIKKEKKRIQYLDIARGIAILLMIVGHGIETKELSYKIIYSFHMPLFLLVSGFFTKENEKLSKTIFNLIFKLALPTAIAWIISQRIMFYLRGWDVSTQLHIQILLAQFRDVSLRQIGVYWFIPFFIETKIIFTCFYKITKGKLLPLAIFSLLSFGIGYFCKENKINLPLRFDIALTCVFLFYFGYVAKKKDLLNKIWKKKWLFVLIIFFWIIIALTVKVDIAKKIYGFWGIGLLGGVCGTIVVCKISELIEKKCTKLADGLAFLRKTFFYSPFITWS